MAPNSRIGRFLRGQTSPTREKLILSDGIRVDDPAAWRLRRGFQRISVAGPLGEEMRSGFVVNESAPNLFSLFAELVQAMNPAGGYVRVELEVSEKHDGSVLDLKAGIHKTVVLLSWLYDFKDTLVHNGFVGITVILEDNPWAEVQLDEHKQIALYAVDEPSLDAFADVLHRHDLPERKKLFQLDDSIGHEHSSTRKLDQEFRTLRLSLCGEVEEEY